MTTAKKTTTKAAPKASKAAPKTRAKNPNKLNGPEKLRFMSVLEKDPDLQKDVIAALRDMGSIPKAPKEIFDDGLKRMPPRVQEAYQKADDVAEAALQKVSDITHDDRFEKLSGQVQRRAGKLASLLPTTKR